MVQSIVEKEKELARLENEIKERQKKETREFIMNYKNRAGEHNSDEKEIEKLIEQQSNEIWSKKKEQWQKQDEARIKLMMEVYDQRANNVQFKKDIKDKELK